MTDNDGDGEPRTDPLGLDAVRKQLGEGLGRSMRPDLGGLGLDFRATWLSTLDLGFQVPTLDRAQEIVARAAADSFKNIQNIFQDLLPENLRDLDADNLRRLHQVAEEQRIGVMWVPSAEVLAELMAVDAPDERSEIIDSRATDIVASCRLRLPECDVPELSDLVQLTLQGVDAFEANHVEAAQALATTVLDTTVTQYFGEGPRRVRASVSEIKKMAARSGTDEEYWRWLLATTMAGIPPSWRDYDYGSEDPMYNRNGTVHCADLTVYSRANAARAMTLATTLLRWMKQEEAMLHADEDS